MFDLLLSSLIIHCNLFTSLCSSCNVSFISSLSILQRIELNEWGQKNSGLM